MAVVDSLSTALTNRDASPKVISDAILTKANMQEAVGAVQATSGDSSTSTYRMVTVRSNARISKVLLSCDGAATAGAADVGVYQTTLNGGAVVDADHFASAQLLTSALVHSDITHESAVYGIEDAEKPLWEALGLSEDSHIDYDIVITLTTGIDAADDMVLKVEFAI